MKTGKIILLLYTVLLFNKPNIYSQSSFSRLISTPKDERLFDAAEDGDGNYFLVGRNSDTNLPSEDAMLLVLNSNGEIIYQNDYQIQDTISYFAKVYSRNDSIIIIGAKGELSVGLSNQLWILILDSEFNIIKNTSYYIPDYYLVDIETIINSKGNYVLTGVISNINKELDMIFYEISSNGDTIQSSIFSYTNLQLEFDLIETQNNEYKVFSNGAFPGMAHVYNYSVRFDSAFNYLGADSIPYDLRFNHTAKWLNDSVYLVSGNKRTFDPTGQDIGIAKLSSSDQFLTGNHFGKIGDTLDYVGLTSNFDFINANSIFFGGTANMHPNEWPYQAENSWILLTNLDSNLNLNWEQYYGGDAYYYLWSLKATQDGGCLMLAARYDENTQDDELDAYILKVDPNGLLTSVNDPTFSIPQGMMLYPNPVSDLVTITSPWLNKSGNKEISIHNSLGKEVKRLSLSGMQESVQVNVSAIPPGLCFVTIFLEGKKMATGKVLIVR